MINSYTFLLMYKLSSESEIYRDLSLRRADSVSESNIHAAMKKMARLDKDAPGQCATAFSRTYQYNVFLWIHAHYILWESGYKKNGWIDRKIRRRMDKHQYHRVIINKTILFFANCKKIRSVFIKKYWERCLIPAVCCIIPRCRCNLNQCHNEITS